MSPLVCATLIVLLEGLCVASLFPVTHAYCAEFGGSVLATGIMFALVSFPKVLLNPFWGHVADRIGRRPVLVMITLGTLAGSIGWAVSRDLWWLAASRLIVGVFGAQAVLAYAIAADTAAPERRAASMGMLGAGFGVALTLGPVVGGIVGARVSNAAVGWMGGGFQAISLLVILTRLRETRPAPDARAAEPSAADRFGWSSTRSLLVAPGVALLLAVTFIMTVGFSILTTSLGEFTRDAFQFTTEGTGYAFAIVGIVTALTQGGATRPVVSALGEAGASRLGLALLAAGFAILAFRPALAWFLVGLAVLSVGGGFVVPALTAMLSRCVGPERQGGVHGVNQAVTGLGRALGFGLGGILFRAFGAATPFATAAGLSATAALLLAAAPRTLSARAARSANCDERRMN
ncbi:MAG: MFS transporter [Phycisphaerae bacterium]|jgi:predicted MFS family arabinose efflux permease